MLYATFMTGQQRYGGPPNQAFLLRRDELIDVVRGHLEVVAFEQGVDAARGTMHQRICARRRPLR